MQRGVLQQALAAVSGALALVGGAGFASCGAETVGPQVSLYEGGIRVAALAYWPGQLAPGRFTQPLAVCDLLPTLASVANVPIPEEVTIEGVNFWPALTEGDPLGERVFCWHVGSRFAIQKGGWKLIHLGPTSAEGADELFHPAEAPYEEREVSEQRPEELAALKEELARQFALDQQL